VRNNCDVIFEAISTRRVTAYFSDSATRQMPSFQAKSGRWPSTRQDSLGPIVVWRGARPRQSPMSFFETNQRPDDLARVSDDEGALGSWLSAQPWSIFANFGGTYVRARPAEIRRSPI
jgi:hypothetical protein